MYLLCLWSTNTCESVFIITVCCCEHFWLCRLSGGSSPSSKTGGAMLQNPCGLLGCPSLLGLPINLWNWKRQHFITHLWLQCKQISDSQAFLSTHRSNIIHSDNNFAVISPHSSGITPFCPLMSAARVRPLPLHTFFFRFGPLFVSFACTDFTAQSHATASSSLWQNSSVRENRWRDFRRTWLEYFTFCR